MTSLLRSKLWMVFLLAFAGVPACADDEPGVGEPTADAALAAPDADPADPDAAPGAPDAAPGDLPFLSTCTSNEDCESGLCFNFNAKGLHCTHACQSAADCEAPSPGCNGMNVCKVP